jgi:hypothetical protein
VVGSTGLNNLGSSITKLSQVLTREIWVFFGKSFRDGELSSGPVPTFSHCHPHVTCRAFCHPTHGPSSSPARWQHQHSTSTTRQCPQETTDWCSRQKPTSPGRSLSKHPPLPLPRGPHHPRASPSSRARCALDLPVAVRLFIVQYVFPASSIESTPKGPHSPTVAGRNLGRPRLIRPTDHPAIHHLFSSSTTSSDRAPLLSRAHPRIFSRNL